MADLLDPSRLAQSLGWLAVLAIPLLLVSATSFVKISVVFAALRNALGAPDLPGTLIVTALALVLSVVVMAPVVDALETAAAPSLAAAATRGQPVDPGELWDRASPPVRDFFARNSDADERALFQELSVQRGSPADAGSLRVLWPAFLLTELKEAFQMALLVVLPFVVIDLVLANILLALGMTSLPPAAVGLPLKLLLFVSVDGFSVLSRALVGGYA